MAFSTPEELVVGAFYGTDLLLSFREQWYGSTSRLWFGAPLGSGRLFSRRVLPRTDLVAYAAIEALAPKGRCLFGLLPYQNPVHYSPTLEAFTQAPSSGYQVTDVGYLLCSALAKLPIGSVVHCGYRPDRLAKLWSTRLGALNLAIKQGEYADTVVVVGAPVADDRH